MVLDRTEHAGMKTGETTCTNAASTTAAPVHVPPTGNCAARQLMCHKHHKCDMRMHNSALGDDTARRRTSSAPHSARNTPSAASPTDVWARHPRTSRVPLLRFQSGEWASGYRSRPRVVFNVMDRDDCPLQTAAHIVPARAVARPAGPNENERKAKTPKSKAGSVPQASTCPPFSLSPPAHRS